MDDDENNLYGPNDPPPPPFIPAKNPFDTYEVLKTAINGAFLGPLKFFTAWSIMLLASPMLLVLTCGKKKPKRPKKNQVDVEISVEDEESEDENIQEPLSGWRLEIVKALSFLPLVIMTCLGFRVKVTGKPVDPKTAPIVVSNHTTIFDGFYLAYALIPAILSKAGVAKVPIIGPTLKVCNAYFFNKFDPSARAKCIAEIRRRVEHGGFKQLLVFPEGTTTNGKYLITFRRGAFSPGVTVQPVVITYPSRFFCPSYVRGGTFWTFWNIFRTTTQFVNYMEVTWLEPYTPNEFEKNDAVLFAHNVREYMSKASGIPVFETRDRTVKRSPDMRPRGRQEISAALSALESEPDQPEI